MEAWTFKVVCKNRLIPIWRMGEEIKTELLTARRDSYWEKPKSRTD